MKRFHVSALLLGGACFFLGGLGISRGLEGSRLVGLPGLGSGRSGLAGSVSAILSVRGPGQGTGGSEFLYAGTRRGLYLSTDQGVHWKRVFNPGFRSEVRTVARDPADSRFILVAAGSALFASSDGGFRWRRILRARVPILCLAMDPHRLKRILVGTSEGIQLSDDQGLSWVGLSEGLPNGSVRSVVIHPTLPGHYYALTDGGLFRLTVDFKGWNRLQVLTRAEEEEPMDTREGSEEPEGSLGVGDLVIEPTHGSLFLGTHSGIFVSRDEGGSWLPLPSAALGTPRIHRLLCGSPGTGSLYAATDAGLFYLPLGTVWSHLHEGLPAGPIRTVEMNPEGRQLLVGTSKGLFRIPVPERPLLSLPDAALLPSVFPGEPSVQEVQRVAIRYAEVMPEKIRAWRAGAVWRNWFPKVTLKLDRDRDTTVVSSTSGGKTAFSIGPEDESVSMGFDFTWDLANFIWNPDQTAIDVRSRLMVQLRQDVLEEVTRLYFERRRLLSEFQRNPTADPLLQEERSLRIEELTAQLDALTGGWFSKSRGPLAES